MAPVSSLGPFNPSQVSQTRVALGQHHHFNPSQPGPFVTGQKVQETPVVIGFVAPVTALRGLGEERSTK